IRVAASVTEVNGQVVWGSPKTHASRDVPVPRFLRDELTVQMAGKGPDDLVFCSPDGSVLRNGNFRRRYWDRAVRAAGADGLTPHDLRHTAASLAIGAGANVKAVQRMLGHKSAAMTLDVYGGLFDDTLDLVADRLDAAVSDATAASLRPGTPTTVVNFPAVSNE
ncbi:MAG: site-specific integrase, partial [Nocardioidaceae bacterium]|nr:site-specific integrase [Nocardioidaceae bacterium]